MLKDKDGDEGDAPLSTDGDAVEVGINEERGEMRSEELGFEDKTHRKRTQRSFRSR